MPDRENPAQGGHYPLHLAGFLPPLFDVRFMAREAKVAVCLQGCADHQHCVTAIRVEGCVQIALPGFRGFPRKPLVDLEGEAPMASGVEEGLRHRTCLQCWHPGPGC